jgi:hypothetical protein
MISSFVLLHLLTSSSSQPSSSPPSNMPTKELLTLHVRSDESVYTRSPFFLSSSIFIGSISWFGFLVFSPSASHHQDNLPEITSNLFIMIFPTGDKKTLPRTKERLADCVARECQKRSIVLDGFEVTRLFVCSSV